MTPRSWDRVGTMTTSCRVPEQAAAPARTQVTGLCLCGGESRRMGRDKALVELGGRRLIDYPLEALAAVAGRTLLATGERPRYAELGLPTVLDTGPGAGPLRGLLAGLEAAETPWVVALACDMPAVSAEVLTDLLAWAASEALDACLAQVGRGSQPLFAVYHRRCALAIRAALSRGERRLVSFHGEMIEADGGERRPLRVGHMPLSESEGEALNLNTPQDLGGFDAPGEAAGEVAL